MDILQKGVLTLLKSAITGEKFDLPENFDFEAACSSVRRHHLSTLLYEGAVNCGIPQGDSTMQRLFQQYCQSLLISEAQVRELQRIYETFDQNGIDYLPLKGSIMKHLYPRHELRMMGDADILIRVEQYDRIIPLMQEMGFEAVKESSHELAWNKKTLYVELHKRLMPEREREWDVKLLNAWSAAIRTNGHCHKLPDEDTFIFLFLHFAKHYTAGGIGCRHMLDLWVFQRTHTGLDQAYIQSRLAEVDMLAFYLNTMDLLHVWFDDGIPNQVTDVMHAYIISSGSFGDEELGIVGRQMRRAQAGYGGCKSKIGFLLARLFPPVKNLRYEYPVLKKWPWLLPVVWIVRLFQKLTRKKSVVKKNIRNMSFMNSDNMDKYTQIMKISGIQKMER